MDLMALFPKPGATKPPPVPPPESSPPEIPPLSASDSSRNPFVSWPTFVDWLTTQLHLPPLYQPPCPSTDPPSSALPLTVESHSSVSPEKTHLPFLEDEPRKKELVLLLPPPLEKESEVATSLSIFGQLYNMIAGGGNREGDKAKQDVPELSEGEVSLESEANAGPIPAEAPDSALEAQVMVDGGEVEGPRATAVAFTSEELEVLNQIRRVVAGGDGGESASANKALPGGSDEPASDTRWWEAIEQKEEGGEGESSSSTSAPNLSEREKLIEAIQAAEEKAPVVEEGGRGGVVRAGESGEGDGSSIPREEGGGRVGRWVGRSEEDESAFRLRLLEEILEEERKKMQVRKNGSRKVKESWEAIVQKVKEKQVAIERGKSESRLQVAAMCRSNSNPLLKQSLTQNQQALLQSVPSSLGPAGKTPISEGIA